MLVTFAVWLHNYDALFECIIIYIIIEHILQSAIDQDLNLGNTENETIKLYLKDGETF